METTKDVRLTLTRTACKIAAKEGWDEVAILDTFDNPKAIYASKTHDGQWRVAGREIVIVGVLRTADNFHGITLIRNGSKAPVK